MQQDNDLTDHPHSMSSNNEIFIIPAQNFDLVDLYNILYSKKLVILLFSIFMTIFGATYIYLSPPYFISKIVFTAPLKNLMSYKVGTAGILGGVGDVLGVGGKSSPQVSYALSVLKSRKFLSRFFKRYDMLPLLLPKYWDAKHNDWKPFKRSFFGKTEDFFLGKEPVFIESDEEKRYELAYKIFSKLISININKDTNIITLNIEWINPVTASKWANQLLAMLNKTMRERTIAMSEKRVAFLQKAINNTNITNVKNILYSLMEKELKTSMIANVQKDFSFTVIDMAYPASRPFKPRKIVILILTFLSGILMSSLYIMARNYVMLLKAAKEEISNISTS